LYSFNALDYPNEYTEEKKEKEIRQESKNKLDEFVRKEGSITCCAGK
jgi:hypothetical protein